ncbi:MAG: hypothetical protein ACI9VR_005228 [Cognaticolwellia sp.]|jgi:hypothetical protein
MLCTSMAVTAVARTSSVQLFRSALPSTPLGDFLLTLLTLLTLVNPALAVDCPAETDQTVVREHLAAAEQAFAERDREAVLQHSDQARASLECLNESMTPEFAAEVHRVEGLRAFMSKDMELAQSSLVSAKLADPDYTLPLELAPEGHRLRELYGADEAPYAATEPVPAPEGVLSFDGQVSLQRPSARPTVMQVQQGGEVNTQVVVPGQALPDYAQPHANSRKVRLSMAGVSLVAAGGMYYMSRASYLEYEPLDGSANGLTEQELDGLRKRNHFYGAGAGVAVAVAAATGVSAFVTVEF